MKVSLKSTLNPQEQLTERSQCLAFAFILEIKFKTDSLTVITLIIEFSDLVVIIQHTSQLYPIHMTIGRQVENFSIRLIEITMPTQLMTLLPSEFSHGFES